MKSDAIAALFSRREQGFAAHNPVALAADYAYNCVVESPIAGRVEGSAANEKILTDLFRAFPDLVLQIEERWSVGNRVAETGVFSGTDIGGFMGLAPTGKRFCLPLVFLYRIENGLIVHERRSYDFSGFLLQLVGDLRTGLESAALYRELLERARLEHEMKMAAAIQRALLPAPHYKASGFEVVATSSPCRAIGGDFFDYFAAGAGTFGFALGDVAGKGPAAALLTAMLQGIFSVCARGGQRPAQVLTAVNDVLVQRTVEARFATIVYGLLSSDGRQLTYCNAGHNPPLLVTANGVKRLETGGTIVGAFPAIRFEEETIELNAGDLLVVFSDGVTEAQDGSEEQFGDERLLHCVQECRHLAPSAILARIFEAVREFSGGATQLDDITALIVQRADTQGPIHV